MSLLAGVGDDDDDAGDDDDDDENDENDDNDDVGAQIHWSKNENSHHRKYVFESIEHIA